MKLPLKKKRKLRKYKIIRKECIEVGSPNGGRTSCAMLKNMFFKKRKITEEIDINNLPKHIAIIMDGNGRWAKKRGLSRSAGHRAGAKTLEKITRYAGNLGIRHLTVYAFSTENWKRPKDEVDALMVLLGEYLSDYKNLIGDDNICIRILGTKQGLSDEILEKIRTVEEATAKNDGLTLNIALNYGSREEITSAVKTLAVEVTKGNININEINENVIASHLYTAHCPEPDLIIRPSGERRLSNFLLWQSAYSEFWFADINWPDFKTSDLDRAIIDFQQRNRRFGGV